MMKKITINKKVRWIALVALPVIPVGMAVSCGSNSNSDSNKSEPTPINTAAINLSVITVAGTTASPIINLNGFVAPANTLLNFQIGSSPWMDEASFKAYLLANGATLSAAQLSSVRARLAPASNAYTVTDSRESAISGTIILTPSRTESILNMELNQPITLQELNAMAAKIPGEDQVPWRRGVSFESGSQALSLIRNFAYELGWSDLEFARTRSTKLVSSLRNRNKVLITDEDLSKTAEQINTQSSFDVATAYDNISIINDFKMIKARTNITEAHKINSFLGIGDDNFYTSVSPETALVDLGGFDYSKYESVYSNALSTNKLRYSAWVDYRRPGELTVQLSAAEVARLIKVPNGTFTYPVINADLFKNEFVPLIKALFNIFLQADLSAALTVLSALLPEETVDYIRYIRAANPTTSKVEEIINKFNNGSHNLLALAGIYRGYDADFVAPTNPLAPFAKTGDNWQAGKAIDGLLKRSLVSGNAAFFGVTDFSHFNSASSAQYGYLASNPLLEANYLAYFTNRGSIDLLLEANGVVRANYDTFRALKSIKVDLQTSRANSVTWLGTNFTLASDVQELKFYIAPTTRPANFTESPLDNVTTITTLNAQASERNLFAKITFKNNPTPLIVDLTESSQIRAVTA